MTIATTSNKVIALGNGVNTVFNFGFAIRQASDLLALYVDANGNETDVTANCVITLNPVAAGAQWAVGGTVTYNPPAGAIALGTQLTIVRTMPLTQLTVFANQGGSFPAVTEQTADMLDMVIQQLQEILNRTPLLSQGKDSSLYTLRLTPVANALLGWDATGKVLGTVASGGVNLVLPGAAGLAVFTGGSAFTSRTLTAADQSISLTNGSGVGGNPTFKIGSGAMGLSMINGTLVPSQNGTVLTVAVKTLLGADPSAADPVYVLFRNATAKTGDFSIITLTAATSVSTAVGATFGVANAVPFRLWVVGFNDGGVFRLGLINCLTTVAGVGAGRDVTSIFPLGQFPIASSTQIGAGSILPGVFYTAGAAVAAKAYSVLGYLAYEAGLVAAGTFGVDQTRTHIQNKNDPLPGQEIQVQRNDTGAVATGSTTIPIDDTIPQNTEGDQYMSQAITPSSAANALEVNTRGTFANGTAGAFDMASALFQDATANALRTSWMVGEAQNRPVPLTLSYCGLSNLSVATTFKVRAGAGGGTTTFNGSNTARKFGGVLNSMLEVKEIMA